MILCDENWITTCTRIRRLLEALQKRIMQSEQERKEISGIKETGE